MGPHPTNAAAPRPTPAIPGGGGGPTPDQADTARKLLAVLSNLDATDAPAAAYLRWVSAAHKFLTELVRDA